MSDSTGTYPTVTESSAQARIGRWQGLRSVGILLALWVAMAVITPHFLSIEVRSGRVHGALVDIVHRAAPVVLLAIGMTLVIAMRGVDLSVGSVMAMAGAVSARLVEAGYGTGAALTAGLLMGVLAGCWNGLLVTWVGMQPIVATLILLVAGRGVAQLITDGQIITFERAGFAYLADGALLGLPVTTWLCAGLLVATAAVLHFSSLGLYVQAIGGNERAARLCGVRVRSVKTLAYGLTGLCAGLAGLIYTADIKAADVNNCGLYIELDAILAVVLGGTPLTGGRPRLVGAVAGALIMQTLTTGMMMRGLGTESILIVKAAVAGCVCLADSEVVRARLRLALARRSVA